jgi:iron uptake system component EfeO
MWRRPGVITLLVGTLSVLSACGSTARVDSGPMSTAVTVSVSDCGAGWSTTTAGPQHFVLHNTDTRAGEILLTDADTAAVYADVEPIGPGTVADLDITLGAGSYSFRCAMEDESMVIGPTVHITGSAAGVTPVKAVDQSDLVAATRRYETYVRKQLPALARRTATLRSAVRAGDVPAAKRAWLPAHLAYERMGAAYGAFGDLDGRINGLPDGLPAGVADPSWTGFHRVEYDLWHGAPQRSTTTAADALAHDVDALAATFAHAQIEPLELSIRAHEITENALQFELTGRTDFGSGSALATVRANLDGTATVLAILTPLLRGRDPGLARISSRMTSATRDVEAFDHAGRWSPLDTLGTRSRERVDADISELTELLAPVASILEPRRTS